MDQQGSHVYSGCVNTSCGCIIFRCVHCVHMHHELPIENSICFLVYILCYVNIWQKHCLLNTDSLCGLGKCGHDFEFSAVYEFGVAYLLIK